MALVFIKEQALFVFKRKLNFLKHIFVLNQNSVI